MAMTDDFVKHNIMLQRLSGTQADLIREHVNSTLQTARDLVYTEAKPSNITEILREAMSPLRDSAKISLEEIAKYESEFTAKTLTKYVEGTVSPVKESKLIRALEKNNMEINNIDRTLGSNKSITNAYKQFGNRKSDELAQIVKDGLYQNLDQAEILANLQRHVDVTIARQIDSLAETSVNYASSIGRNETMTQADQIEYVEWVLDDSVMQHTDYCLEHEGNIYVSGDSPVPPAHWGCQSDLVPWFGDPNEVDIGVEDSGE